MIDLHIHTIYSDGADTLTEVLKKAEKLKLEYISITDHDNCYAYDELKKTDERTYIFSCFLLHKTLIIAHKSETFI